MEATVLISFSVGFVKELWGARVKHVRVCFVPYSILLVRNTVVTIEDGRVGGVGDGRVAPSASRVDTYQDFRVNCLACVGTVVATRSSCVTD
jgi:hypothetical protein